MRSRHARLIEKKADLETYSLRWVEQAHSEAAGSDEVSGCDSTQERTESAARRGVNRLVSEANQARGSAASVSLWNPLDGQSG